MIQNSFPKIEEEILKFWQKNKIFQKSLKKESPKGDFIFYDGPPFATGLPHYGHIIASAIKDIIPRYKTMQGFRVNRRWGWDCHGLPIENLIEKELGLKTKKDIEKLGIDKFNQACRNSVLRYADQWKKFIPRMARWVDMENDYRTMDNRYIEVIWWIFKELYKDGLIYEGYKSMHLCPRCETTLSNFEVTLGYRDVKDLSVYVKFRITNYELRITNLIPNIQYPISNIYLLAWTTTSWTLPGNMALAVSLDIRYWILAIKNEEGLYIIAKDRVKEVMKDKEYKKIGEIKGADLIGLEYEPLFDFAAAEIKQDENYQNAFKVYAADFVSTQEGTGIVHIAPAFGEDDYQFSQKHQIPFLQHVNRDGTFKNYVKPWAGQKAREKDDDQTMSIEIIKWLAAHNQLFAKEKFTHSYPYCWRCDTPLLNYATSSWFVRIDDDFKKRLLAANDKVNWVPEHLKDGRFGKWLEGARDWAISRSRYWGAPLPVWRCQKCQNIKVIGSIAELEQNKISDKEPEILDSSCEGSFLLDARPDCHLDKNIKQNQKFVKLSKNSEPTEGIEPSTNPVTTRSLHHAAGISSLYQNDRSQTTDLHRPDIDKVQIICSKCNGKMIRISEVFDCWFESGSMPYASELIFSDYQLAPQTTRQDILNYIKFPADFIAEGIDQTRGWFYTLLVLGVALYDQSPFKNVGVNGIILAEDGQKMSKRLKNYPDPMSIIDKYGADALRFYLLSSPAVRGESLNFSEKGVDEVYKKVILLSLNVLKFWEMYADANLKFKIKNLKLQLKIKNLLDRWIIERLNQLEDEVTESFNKYEIDKACRPIIDFVNDLSTWYLRRSREKFKIQSVNSADKIDQNNPVVVLGYVLLEFSKVLAPICPFLAEHVYQNVSCFMFHVSCKESVHLENWGIANCELRIINYELLDMMQKVREICEIGHSLRSEVGIKVRQVLSKFKIQNSKFKIKDTALQLYSFTALIQDELNVKEIEIVDKLPEGEGWISKDGAALYTVIDAELREEGIIRELTRQVNNLRKKQGLTIEDKVRLEYATESERLRQIIEKHKEKLMSAVLARAVVCQNSLDGERLMVEGDGVIVKLRN